MELTISQIGSAAPHWIARYVPAASRGVHTMGINEPQLADSMPPTAAADHGDLETEYDQFGRFGVDAGAVAEGSESSFDYRPVINPTKHFRSGQVTVGELESEYARSLLDSSIGPDGETGSRRFIPAFMTEYQVYQLFDFQYRWAIEVERRMLARVEEMELAHPAVPEVVAADGSPPSPGFGR